MCSIYFIVEKVKTVPPLAMTDHSRTPGRKPLVWDITSNVYVLECNKLNLVQKKHHFRNKATTDNWHEHTKNIKFEQPIN